MLYVPSVLVLTPSHALCMICGFIISVQEKLITLMTTEILHPINVPVILHLLLLHPLSKLTSGMTVFMLNPPSNILVMQVANVVVVLTHSLHVLPLHGKHSKNYYLSSPTMQSEQNLEGSSSTCVRKVILFGSKTWPVVTEDVQQLVTADWYDQKDLWKDLLLQIYCTLVSVVLMTQSTGTDWGSMGACYIWMICMC